MVGLRPQEAIDVPASDNTRHVRRELGPWRQMKLLTSSRLDPLSLILLSLVQQEIRVFSTRYHEVRTFGPHPPGQGHRRPGREGRSKSRQGTVKSESGATVDMRNPSPRVRAIRIPNLGKQSSNKLSSGRNVVLVDTSSRLKARGTYRRMSGWWQRPGYPAKICGETREYQSHFTRISPLASSVGVIRYQVVPEGHPQYRLGKILERNKLGGGLLGADCDPSLETASSLLIGGPGSARDHGAVADRTDEFLPLR